MSIFDLSLFYIALAAGILIALLAGVLSTSVVIRKMSFFSDAIAHASLTGIALGFLWQINVLWSAILFAVLVGLGIAYLSKRNTLSLDTIIGIFYSAAVALGVIVISSLSGTKVDLVGALFGDILATSTTDLLLIAGLTVGVLVAYVFLFRSLMQIALSKDLARVDGIKVDLVEYAYMVLLALTVAIGLKLVGIILIAPLLIIPAAVAKNLSRSLKGLILISILSAILGVLAGFYISVFLNVPTGPLIVLIMTILFAVSIPLKKIIGR